VSPLEKSDPQISYFSSGVRPLIGPPRLFDAEGYWSRHNLKLFHFLKSVDSSFSLPKIIHGIILIACGKHCNKIHIKKGAISVPKLEA
jgi:hypothetical protein